MIHALTENLDFAAIVLVFLLAGSVWILFKAQQQRGFDLSKMLRDDNGKESALNLCILGSFAISAWMLMFDTLHHEETDWKGLLVFLLIWSGARVAVIAAQKWNGNLPWTKKD